MYELVFDCFLHKSYAGGHCKDFYKVICDEVAEELHHAGNCSLLALCCSRTTGGLQGNGNIGNVDAQPEDVHR